MQTIHRTLVVAICCVSLSCFGLSTCDGAEESEFSVLQNSLTFHANFDKSLDAVFAKGDAKLYTASALSRKDAKPGNGRADVSVIKNGKFHNALRFGDKAKQVIFYRAQGNMPYRKTNWSGTVSFWLRLNPAKDLKPGYVDPIQITDKRWNDASFFLDFTKDDKPRHFRLGTFADLKFWNPKNIKWEKIPAEDRPLVVVKKTPFSRERWTHVLFTFSDFNVENKSGKSRLYLDGKLQGTLTRPQHFTWESKNAAIMIGLSYIGDMDDLAIFNRSLTTSQIQRLYKSKTGISAFHKQK